MADWSNVDDMHTEVHVSVTEKIVGEQHKATIDLGVLKALLGQNYTEEIGGLIASMAQSFYKIGYFNALAWSTDNIVRQVNTGYLGDIQDEGVGL